MFYMRNEPAYNAYSMKPPLAAESVVCLAEYAV